MILAVIITIIVLLAGGTDYPIYTDKSEDYGASEYYLVDNFFPPELPEEAEVVAYHNYSFYQEDFDQYIELRFDSKEQMDAYLDSLFAHIDESRGKTTFTPSDGEWFLREENPHDPTFVDYFYKMFEWQTGLGYWGGYESTDDSYKCRYALISYSYDSLTVIQAYATGGFYDLENDYVPKYFERFNVAPDEDRYF